MVKIQMNNTQAGQDQFFLYIPIQIVRAMGWNKGDEIAVEILGKDKLKLEKVKTMAYDSQGNSVKVKT